MTSRLARAVLYAAAVALPVSTAAAADRFEARKQARIADCEAIPADAYSTAMIFNPAGLETMFERSRCLQELAVAERDAALCADVRERKSWLFDGSGVSREACRTRVAERIAEDERELAAHDFASLRRLTSIELVRNGNGTDFDLIVTTEGSADGRYELEVRAALAGGGAPVTITRRSHRYGGPNVPRLLLLDREILIERLGKAVAESRIEIGVSLRFEKTPGNRFYYHRIPPALRESRLALAVRLADLPPWRPERSE